MAATLAQTEVIERGVIIVLHVAGVLYSSYVEKENLPKAMITGRKRVD
jgi:cytochrome b